MCNTLDELRDELKDYLTEEIKHVRGTVCALSETVDGHADKVAQAAVNAENALKGINDIKVILENAHITDAAEIMVGGETLARNIISISKFFAALSIIIGTIYTALTNNSVATWISNILNWRVH